MQNTPRQTKLLGATVNGLGLVVAVSSTLTHGYAVVEDADKVNRRVALRDLKRDEVVFPAHRYAFETGVQRVDYGVWDEVHSLVPAVNTLAVAA